MSSIFLSPEISIELFLELTLLVVFSFAFVKSLVFLKEKDNLESPEKLYELEKKSYLVETIITVSLGVKILLLVFFVYALDQLSAVVPGAMCVTGVLEANGFGIPLLVLKIVLLLLVSLWLMLKDFKNKIRYFIPLFILFLIEFILSIVFLSSIDVSAKVSCCSANLFVEKNTIPFNLSSTTLLYLFIFSYLLMILSAFFQKKIVLLVLNLIFLYVTYYVLVYYFGAYIYDDETHICPYCMLKQQYYFIGYFIYALLFLSILNSSSMLINKSKDRFKQVVFFTTTLILFLFIIVFINNLF